jgi:hypothetical protein
MTNEEFKKAYNKGFDAGYKQAMKEALKIVKSKIKPFPEKWECCRPGAHRCGLGVREVVVRRQLAQHALHR